MSQSWRLWLTRLVQSNLAWLRRELAPVRRVLRRQQAIVALLAALLLVVIHAFFVPDGERGAVFVDTAITVLTTLAIAYASFNLLAPYRISSERDRIMAPSKVVEFYESPKSFITPSQVSGWRPQLPTDSIPVAVEHAPEQPTHVEDLQIHDSDSYYELSPKLNAFVEPRIGELEELFFHEGYFSSIQARLDRVEDDVFFMERTSYYRSFITNFCPDYDIYKGKTLRELSEELLFEDEDQLRPLKESPFSDHLGVAGLVVTPDGSILLSVRGRGVAIDKRTKAISFSGSASHGVGSENVIKSSLLAELDEELSIGEEHVQAIQYLGTVRRMERLGKPDAVAVVLVDEQSTWCSASPESTDVSQVNVNIEQQIDGIDSLFRKSTAEAIIRAIANELATTSYRAEIGLLTFVYLFAYHSEIQVPRTIGD